MAIWNVALIAALTGGMPLGETQAAKEASAALSRDDAGGQPNAKPTDFGAMRAAGEAAIRARLVDPSSAQFEWPYGFVAGNWGKPSKKNPAAGMITCGFVNSKNRMGGYTGRVFFVVEVANGVVVNADIGSGRGAGYDIVGAGCAKSAHAFPPPQEGMLVATSENGTGIADELNKLSKLRDSGVISSAEFDALKRKLLSN